MTNKIVYKVYCNKCKDWTVLDSEGPRNGFKQTKCGKGHLIYLKYKNGKINSVLGGYGT